MKSILPVLAAAAAALIVANPVLACEFHQSHTAMKTVEASPQQPAPVVAVAPTPQSTPASQMQAETQMSRPLGAAYENCNRARKDTTVYLTQ